MDEETEKKVISVVAVIITAAMYFLAVLFLTRMMCWGLEIEWSWRLTVGISAVIILAHIFR